MRFPKAGTLAAAISLLTLIPMAAACGGGDAGSGLSREEVREIVRAELAGSAPRSAQPGLTRPEVEEAVQAAISQMRESEPGLSRTSVDASIRAALADLPGLGVNEARLEAEVARLVAAMPAPGLTENDVLQLIAIAAPDTPIPMFMDAMAQQAALYAVATIPPRSSQAEYTQFFVNTAIARYETEGLEATLAHYNRAESVDGQWYMFIADQDGVIIGHHNSHLLGEDLNGPLGTDAEGYRFGPEMLAATGEGTWVSYVYNNPATDNLPPDHLGAVQLKNAWVVRHDGLLFGSGWYASSDEYTRMFVQQAIDRFHADGLEETLAHYNSADSVFREWFAFIADEHGKVIAHHRPELLGLDLDEVLGTDSFQVSAEGDWVTVQDTNPATGETGSKHTWLVSHDGMTFGSGWFHDEEDH